MSEATLSLSHDEVRLAWSLVGMALDALRGREDSTDLRNRLHQEGIVDAEVASALNSKLAALGVSPC